MKVYYDKERSKDCLNTGYQETIQFDILNDAQLLFHKYKHHDSIESWYNVVFVAGADCMYLTLELQNDTLSPSEFVTKLVKEHSQFVKTLL